MLLYRYHARAFVRRLQQVKQQGSPSHRDGNSVLAYENIEGGHGGAADSKQQAVMQTLVYSFLWNSLGGGLK
jgi:prolyl oligopeptidase PreP (S9A serine peptidase family)